MDSEDKELLEPPFSQLSKGQFNIVRHFKGKCVVEHPKYF